MDWIYKEGGASQVYPDKLEEFLAPIPEAERGDLVEAYRKRLTGEDEAVQLAAAKAWSKWEGETVTLLPEPPRRSSIHEREVAVAVARIENHYMATNGWFEEGQLLARRREAARHPRRDRPGAVRLLHSAGRRVEAQAGVARGRAEHHPRRRPSVQRAGRARRLDPRDGQVRGSLATRPGGTSARCGPSAGRDRNRPRADRLTRSAAPGR